MSNSNLSGHGASLDAQMGLEAQAAPQITMSATGSLSLPMMTPEQARVAMRNPPTSAPAAQVASAAPQPSTTRKAVREITAVVKSITQQAQNLIAKMDDATPQQKYIDAAAGPLPNARPYLDNNNRADSPHSNLSGEGAKLDRLMGLTQKTAVCAQGPNGFSLGKHGVR